MKVWPLLHIIKADRSAEPLTQSAFWDTGLALVRGGGKEPEERELSCKKNILLLLLPLPHLHFSSFLSLAEQGQGQGCTQGSTEHPLHAQPSGIC